MSKPNIIMIVTDQEYAHQPLPASFFDDLSNHPQAVQNYKVMSDGTYGRIPMERRDMWHNHVNYYLNCMIDVDRHIGTVLDALEESGQDADTIIIFTSDHGEMGGALYDLQTDPEEMDNLADPENPKYDQELLASINDKLNALIVDEIGDDRGMRERLLQD